MAEYSSPMTLTTPAGTITFTGAAGDRYYVDPEGCSGLDMAPVRIVIDEKPQTDGGIVHPSKKGARHVVIAGLLLSDTVAGRNALEAALTAALESLDDADGTLAWTPTGGTLHSLAVRCDVPASYPGPNQKRFIFGLVAAVPTISIA